MAKCIFIAGTDTDIGKTTVAKSLIGKLRDRGEKVTYYKPVQSGGSGDTDQIGSLDVDVVNLYTFEKPYSPHYASEFESVEIDPSKISKKYKELKKREGYLIVEGAGGLIVPLVRGAYYLSDMISDMVIPVLLVTELRVGGINHTLLSYNHLKSIGVRRVSIYANRYGDSEYERDNKTVVEGYTGIEVLTNLRGDDTVDRLFR